MNDPHAHPLTGELRRALAGRYEVDRLLGTGGMGSVFLGRDPTLDRPIAIKVVDPELSASRAIRERFLQEARTVARLRHPNIVAVHAAGEADGLLWFAMEYVEGESLRELLEREGCCADGRARSILRDVADALAYAHAQGIVHRDIKPDNILIERGTGRAMVTDFGVARALAPGDSRLTGTGLVVGSPRYMSPEQASGEREVDGRSDVYSLGLVGYEMYAGAPALGATSGPTLLIKQITEKPAPLATRAEEVPPDVAAAIDRALEKDPAARWQSAADMARALSGGSSSESWPAASAAVASRRLRRRRAALGAAVLGALVAIGGGVLVTRAGGEGDGGDPRMSYFVAPFDVLTGDPQLEWLREGSVSMLTLNLAQWQDLYIVDYERSLDLLRDAGIDAERKVGLEEARSVAGKVGVGTVVMGRVSALGDSLVVDAQLYDVETGRQVDRAQRSARLGADPRPVFDALARDLLDLIDAPQVALGVAQSTTTSVEAYRAYLEGLAALNTWRLARADSLFAEATRADSTFALAYYKRAQTRGWMSGTDTMQIGLIEHAVEHSSRLPEREREIVSAYSDLVAGLTSALHPDRGDPDASFEAAQRKYAAVVQRDPGATEAWYGLGDAYFHEPATGAEFVEKRTKALHAFDRTLALDSSFHLAYSHKLDIYRTASTPATGIVLDGDSLRIVATDSARAAFGGREAIEGARERAQRLAVRDARLWTRTDPAPQAYEGLAYIYAEAGEPDSAVAVLREAMSRPTSRWDRFGFLMAGMQTRVDPRAALETLRTALRETTAEELRAESRNNLFNSVLVGAVAAAATGSRADLRATAELAAAAEPRTPGLNYPSGPQSRWYVAGVELAMGLPPARLLPMLDSGMRVVEEFPGPFGPQVRQGSYMMPYVVYLVTREPRYLEAVRRWRGSAPALAELDALEALEKGDTAAARRAAASFPSPDSARAAETPLALARWIARAEVLQALGDLRGAIAMYEVLDPRYFAGQNDPAWPLWTRSFLARGRLYEEIGERARAAEAYERFLSLWEDADPALEPQKREAREGLERVRGGMVPRGE